MRTFVQSCISLTIADKLIILSFCFDSGRTPGGLSPACSEIYEWLLYAYEAVDICGILERDD